MSSCSSLEAKSVVELSANRHFHYHYSNISKISEKLTKDEADYEKTCKILICYFLTSCEIVPHNSVGLGNYYRFGQDMCMVEKSHSPCLEGRVYGHKANSLGKGIVEGYKVGFTHIHLEKGWSVPIAIDVVSPKEHTKSDATLLAINQLKRLLSDDTLPFSTSYCINNADSGFGNAKFLAPLYAHAKLLNIVRLRAGMRVYKVFSGAQTAKKNPKIYGEIFYLNSVTQTKEYQTKNVKTKEEKVTQKYQKSIMDCPFDDYQEENIILGNGRKAIKKIWYWKNWLIRSKKGNNMKDKPFDLLKIEIWDENNVKKVFNRDMFLSVNGQAKDKLLPQEAYFNYRTRFDVESCYRFSKQNLFLGKFQTPDKQHFLNHLLVILSSWWLLYAAKNEVKQECSVWQQYLPINKQAQQAEDNKEKVYLTPSQVRKGIGNLFDTFDKKPFLPKKCKKGQGRKVGTIIMKRKTYKPCKKPKKEVKKE